MNSNARRIIWDGTQELGEIQAPWESGNPALEEMDLGWGTRPFNTNDPNPFFGRVVYGPMVGIDQPLSVTRYDYRDNTNSSPLTWPTFSLMIFWDYRGSPVYGLFTDGNWAKPHTFTGQTSCQLTGSQRCVKVQWLFAQSALNQLRGVVQIPSWYGTLLVNKRDAQRTGVQAEPGV